jgi:hypothetical protein
VINSNIEQIMAARVAKAGLRLSVIDVPDDLDIAYSRPKMGKKNFKEKPATKKFGDTSRALKKQKRTEVELAAIVAGADAN